MDLMIAFCILSDTLSYLAWAELFKKSNNDIENCTPQKCMFVLLNEELFDCCNTSIPVTSFQCVFNVRGADMYAPCGRPLTMSTDMSAQRKCPECNIVLRPPSILDNIRNSQIELGYCLNRRYNIFGITFSEETISKIPHANIRIHMHF